MWRRLLIVSGVAALVAFLMRRRRPAWQLSATENDPADELRRKLDETRERESPQAPALGEDDPDARRREVHTRGQAAAEEMRRSGGE